MDGSTDGVTVTGGPDGQTGRRVDDDLSWL